MALGSMEYKELVVEFGRDLSRIADELYRATTEELPPDRRAGVIIGGKRKVREYQAFLGRVEGARRLEVERRFGDSVDEISGFLRTLGEA